MVTGRFYPDYSGGARQALSIARAMHAKNLPVMVFTLDLQKSIWTSATKLDFVDDIPVYRVPGRSRSKFETVVRYVRLVFECWRRRKLFDVVHAHGLIESYVSLLVSKLTRRPSLAKLAGVSEIISHWFVSDTISEAGLGVAQKRAPLNKKIQQALTRLQNRVVCTTPKLYSICRGIGLPKSRLSLIPNGVDVNRFTPLPSASKRKLRKAFGWSPDEFVVATVLSLRPIKGLDILLDAWLKSESAQPRRLVVIGPNEDGMVAVDKAFAESIRRKSARAPQHAAVDFVGQVADVQPYLSAANAFVLPSRSEGFPNAALEAMASGLPCVFSNISWVKGVIDDETNALLFASEDGKHLRIQLDRLMDDQTMQRRLGRSARKTVEQRFAIEAVAEQYQRLYRKLWRTRS
jgi:glycosyltransferase involved in cell wall biosynthesis